MESETGKGSSFIVSIPLGSAHLAAERIGGTRTLTTTAVGAAPFVEEALRWLPDSEQTLQTEALPYDELMPVPCPILPEGDRGVEKRPRVLVADDNSDMRQYLTRLLSERYEVSAVPDGKAALEEARIRVPDLVLSDVMMPNLDGFGLLGALRGDAETRTIPIILLSARAGEESRVEGMEHGADDYLIKPFSARELLARVQTHLEMARVRKQGQEALRQRTAQFETLLNAAPVAVYVVDADFRIREMNPQAMSAFDNASHIGSNFEEFIKNRYLKEQSDEILRRFHHTLETGTPYAAPEWKQKGPDRNSNAVYEWQINRIPLPDGRQGVVCYFRDISHIVKAREAIAASELRLRLAQKAARSGTWERNLLTGQLFVSPEMQELWGFPSDGLSDDTPSRFRDAIHAADMVSIDKELSRLLENHSTDYHVEYRITRTDGASRWIESNGKIFYDGDGKPERLIGISADITERKQVEERERRLTADAIAANAKFRAVFEQTQVFAGITSNDGTLIDANRLCLDACGYRAEEVLGRPLWETPWWRKSPKAQDAIRNAAAEAARGNPYRDVLTYHWADGTERLVEFALHPIRDHEGKVIFLHPTGVDITDLKSAEANYRSLAESLDAEVRARTQELELRNEDVVVQSEQLRDLSRRLLQVQDEERRRIARELHDSAGQILTALGMNLARLAQQARKNGSQLAGDAEEGQQLVQQLTQEIRTMSYLLHPPLLDETGLAEAVRWYIQGLADRNGLEIKLNVSTDFGRLSREAELVMFRLVQECLTNIHRHSGSKTAFIQLTRNDGIVCLEIRDQGKGMPPEKLAQIQSKGSGVGITGMRERVRQFGGRMDIDSNPGGTRMSFTLPLGNARSSQSPDSLSVPA